MRERERNLRIIAEIVFAAALIAAVYLAVRYVDEKRVPTSAEETQTETERRIFPDETVTIQLGERVYEMDHAVSTYLILGTDQSGNEEGVGEEYRGSMADALMLLVVDDHEQCYGILQLNRDTITEITMLQSDGSGYASADLQLCTAHWYGGDKKASCENTVEAVSDMLGGLPIDGYYALQMEAMQMLNHEVGGVTVTLEDDMSALDPLMEKGATLTLTDAQAEILLHARYDMADDRNTERMRRQRIFMMGFFEKAKLLSRGDSDFAIRLYDSLHPYATADININDMTAVIKHMNSYRNLGIFTVGGQTKIGQRLGDGEDHWEFYMDEQSLEQVMKSLYPLEYVEDALPDES